MKKYFTLIICFTFCAHAFAQFQYKSKIQEVDEDGFCNILLTPEVLTHSAADLSDLRIKDASGKEIPFLMRMEDTAKTVIGNDYFTQISIHNFIQKDSSDKITYLRFPEVTKSYKIDQISFNIDYKTDYLRSVEMLETDTATRWVEQYKEFTISSKKENIIPLRNFSFNKNIIISIENKDNSPLKIKEITLFQFNHYLTASLDKGTSYTLYYGDHQLPKPQYDIVYFTDKIPAKVPLLNLQNEEQLFVQQPILPQVEPEKEKLFIETPAFLWGTIIIAGILLFILCYKMLKDKDKKG